MHRDAEKRAAAQAKAQKNRLDQESKGKESKENDKESNASKYQEECQNDGSQDDCWGVGEMIGVEPYLSGKS